MSSNADSFPIPYRSIPGPTEWCRSPWDILQNPRKECLSRSPIGSPQDIGSCLCVLSVPQSYWESSEHPILPKEVSCLSHSPTGFPGISQKLPPLGVVLSVLQSHWKLPGYPKDTHRWKLSQCPVCPTSSPQDIPCSRRKCPVCPTVPPGVPRHPKHFQPWESELSQCRVCPTVPLGVRRTSQGCPRLKVVTMHCWKLSHCLVCPTVPLGVPRTSHTPKRSVLSVPQSYRESQGHPKESHPWELSQCPVCSAVLLGIPGTS